MQEESTGHPSMRVFVGCFGVSFARLVSSRSGCGWLNSTECFLSRAIEGYGIRKQSKLRLVGAARSLAMKSHKLQEHPRTRNDFGITVGPSDLE